MALRITFVKSGINAEKAVTGDLTLCDANTVVARATAFSGGSSFNPLDDGVYRLRLNIRGQEASDEANTDGTMKPFFGIQKVGRSVPDGQGGRYDMQLEWGSIRARLNPTGGAPDHGDYIHGKTLPHNYTHGCICDKSEAVLSYLWNLATPPAAIDVVVSGGARFDLEQLIPKNAGRRLQPKTEESVKPMS